MDLSILTLSNDIGTSIMMTWLIYLYYKYIRRDWIENVSKNVEMDISKWDTTKHPFELRILKRYL